MRVFLTALALCLALMTGTQGNANGPVSLVHGPSHFADAAASVLREAYARAGLAVSFEAMPRPRSLRLSSEGQRDGEVFRTPAVLERYPTLRPVGPPLMTLQTLAYARRGSDLEITGVEDISDLTAVHLRGVPSQRILAERAAKAIEMSTLEQMLAFVAAGRADIVIYPAMSTDSALLPEGIENLEVVAILSEVPAYHMLHESRTELIARIAPILQNMAESGEMDGYIRDRIKVH